MMMAKNYILSQRFVVYHVNVYMCCTLCLKIWMTMSKDLILSQQFVMYHFDMYLQSMLLVIIELQTLRAWSMNVFINVAALLIIMPAMFNCKWIIRSFPGVHYGFKNHN